MISRLIQYEQNKDNSMKYQCFLFQEYKDRINICPYAVKCADDRWPILGMAHGNGETSHLYPIQTRFQRCTRSCMREIIIMQSSTSPQLASCYFNFRISSADIYHSQLIQVHFPKMNLQEHDRNYHFGLLALDFMIIELFLFYECTKRKRRYI